MSDRVPSERPARLAFPYWAIAVIAVGLGFVMLVVMHGLPVTGQMISTWVVSSAAGVIVFCLAVAVRRRREK